VVALAAIGAAMVGAPPVKADVLFDFQIDKPADPNRHGHPWPLPPGKALRLWMSITGRTCH
jgi:hypothetical protein